MTTAGPRTLGEAHRAEPGGLPIEDATLLEERELLQHLVECRRKLDDDKDGAVTDDRPARRFHPAVAVRPGGRVRKVAPPHRHR